ncbi:MAG: hypothetical protein KDI27_03685 [Gammaproteobacteria bacterium]|nr:hypothetical protein [Gammaproteobacteria bacterium]MCB1849656.1 hypothetical protein [Gammaproteobacteria bacterium]
MLRHGLENLECLRLIIFSLPDLVLAGQQAGDYSTIAACRKTIDLARNIPSRDSGSGGKARIATFVDMQR